MEDNLAEIKRIIENAGVSSYDVEELENMIKQIRYRIQNLVVGQWLSAVDWSVTVFCLL